MTAGSPFPCAYRQVQQALGLLSPPWLGTESQVRLQSRGTACQLLQTSCRTACTRVDGGSCVKLSPQRGQCWHQPEGAGTATAAAFPGEHLPQQPSLHKKQPHGLFKPGTCLYNTLENTSPVPTCTSLGKNSVQETKHVPGTCTRARLSASHFGRRTSLLGAQTKPASYLWVAWESFFGLDCSFKLTLYPMLICVVSVNKNLHKLKGQKIIFLLFTHSGSLICRMQKLKTATRKKQLKAISWQNTVCILICCQGRDSGASLRASSIPHSHYS